MSVPTRALRPGKPSALPTEQAAFLGTNVSRDQHCARIVLIDMHFKDLDQVTLANGLVLHNQSIGDATQSADFQGVDGIVGVGPAILTEGTLSPAKNTIIPTVMDTALAQGVISTEVLGVSFAPTTSPNISSTLRYILSRFRC